MVTLIEAGGWSVKGKRPLNEDSFFAGNVRGGAALTEAANKVRGGSSFTGKLGGEGRFFFVADGMGGHDAGDAASSFLTEKIPAAPHPLDRESLERHIIAVHEALLSFAKERGSPNMGSTLAGILLQEGESAWYNLGDSRVYRLRRGYLSQLSNDDSLAAIAPGSPSNIITNAMGAGLASVFVQSRFSPSLAVSGDVFLMCSDGVHGVIDDDTLETMLGAKTEPEETARLIVEKAITDNSDDNCTALVVKLLMETRHE
ncbi:hypothetical protein FACS1894151_00820 [Spirochaetia bacterium]|nr:hypothetical protein FACS1894151_00820 [Spirochaetia bacterium]